MKQLRFFILVLAWECVGFSLAFGADDLIVSRKEWKVGFSRFYPDSDSPSLQRAASLVPFLILDRVRSVKEHLVTFPEARSMAEDKIADFRKKSLSELEKLYDQRDNLLFSPSGSVIRKARLDRKIQEARKQFDARRQYKVEDVTVPSKLKVLFVKPADNTSIFQSEGNTPMALFRNKSLDLLVSGTISNVGEYFVMVIKLYSRFREKVLWEGVASQNDFDTIAETVANAMRLELLGRRWSGVELKVEPVNSVIMVNGNIRGVGKWYDATLEPGKLEVEFQAQGYTPEIREVVLEYGKVTRLSIELQKTANSMVLVRTNPPGADVRLSGVWKGVTPLAVMVPDQVVSLGLEKEGYKKIIMSMGSDARIHEY